MGCQTGCVRILVIAQVFVDRSVVGPKLPAGLAELPVISAQPRNLHPAIASCRVTMGCGLIRSGRHASRGSTRRVGSRQQPSVDAGVASCHRARVVPPCDVENGAPTAYIPPPLRRWEKRSYTRRLNSLCHTESLVAHWVDVVGNRALGTSTTTRSDGCGNVPILVERHVVGITARRA